ncbi:Protein of unknown function [Roseovarius azorensis]|uniref:DUF2927 domain-containing protein n=1 Tax=Roseovarius azorensis TaxID=1287727 RepID=A0A1H7VUH6_9RHOB|nr:DUF2927 domain-containing protein [Roseovarius azorensis]SEM12475.1 Protein of unknown function [Roseovarius azorensis]
MRAGGTRSGLLGLALLALAACDIPPTEPRADAPAAAPPAPPGPSVRSQALAGYYARVESDLLGRGLLRTDGGGPDTPYTHAMLLRNFERIVFYDEYAPGAGYRPSSGRAGGLRKWTGPVRISVEFGASVPDEQRDSDRHLVSDYAARLARITRHPIGVSTVNPNFHVLFMGEDDRDILPARIRQILPNIGESTLSIFRTMPRSIHCLVVAFSSGGGDHTYRRAIALIRTEHPPLLRQSCVHEELAQGLGLADDSPQARPSIFNDDDEFALLTSHDEILLELLYHPELKPGMTPDEARPIVRRLLDARTGGPV